MTETEIRNRVYDLLNDLVQRLYVDGRMVNTDIVNVGAIIDGTVTEVLEVCRPT